MAQALFICVNSPSLRQSDLTNLGVLAGVSRSADLSPALLVVDTVEAASIVDRIPDAFETVCRVAAPEDFGDGALYLDRLVSKMAAESRPRLIVSASTLSSRSWAARLASDLEAVFVPACDVLEIRNGQLVATGPMMGGIVRKTVTLAGKAEVILYSGEDLAYTGGYRTGPQISEAVMVAPEGARLLCRSPLPDIGGIPLKGAAKVVSGGLGIGSAENWSKIEGFATRVGAAVGASRAAVDMGWVPTSRQVGFSGQKVAPDVYVAFGISGAVHHLAGISGARRIVAVNKDPEAPIFQVADVAIIGDCEAVLAAAHKKLDQV